ncbi:MAG: hypothetical protein L0Z54_03400 [Thermoplasmata archaeon]|nr:hypothetical protein [Thermoplasmata archaeon]
MNWTVLKVSDAKVLNALLAHDIVSRQSVSVRDDTDGGKVVLIEGSDEALAMARDIARDSAMKDDDAKRWYDRIREEEASVAIGLGAIFD